MLGWEKKEACLEKKKKVAKSASFLQEKYFRKTCLKDMPMWDHATRGSRLQVGKDSVWEGLTLEMFNKEPKVHII